ncbi:MAG: hypothetical protein WBZ54_15265, partial [Methylocella sp.]
MQASGTLVQAAQTDTSQALNPKSLVSTTNKLQQFVARFETLECLTMYDFKTARCPGRFGKRRSGVA